MAQAARSWRDRWAVRETRRRQRAYQQALAGWEADDSEVAKMITAAETYKGASDSVAGTVVLKRGEKIFYSLPAVSLVEVQRAPGQYTGGYSGFSFRLTRSVRYHVGGSRGTYVQGAEQLKVTDEGSATITNQRVVFAGAKNAREWNYSKLVSIEHDDQRPVTMIGVSSRQKISGLVYPVEAAGGFRFGLSLSLAHYRDDVAGFVATLESEQSAHRAERPSEPAPARPEDATASAAALLGVLKTIYTGKPQWKPRSRIALGLVSAFVTLGLIGAATGAGNDPQKPSTTTAALVDIQAQPTPASTASADAVAARQLARKQASEQARERAQEQARLARQQARAAAAREAARVEARRQARAAARAAERARQARIARREAAQARRAAAAAAANAKLDPRFDWCYEANAAGYGNYVQGRDPEYDWYDDADNDGVVCEF